ncbi:neutral/alkaline non-lysosomal ceramidase N-terminal domain-containing protein [Plantactinospora sonchi]|uniref:Neutral/alkaline non-lysosomal ceramidase N-terminal domain-containing protein n=1 Tax=Plantactinospora sonchi TaxID=1544735 RepID=A0ABU7S296_9ACTN
MDVTTSPGARAGAGSAVVALPPTVPMAGYGTRTEPSSGVLRPLEVNALALGYADHLVLLLAVDAVGVDRGFVAAIRESVADRGFGADQVLVAASHTHSGPAGLRTGGAEGAAAVDPVVRGAYLDATRAAVDAALASVGPAEVSVRTGQVPGVAAHRHDPTRPVDQSATLLLIADRRGNPLAYLWNFACHPTVLGARNTLISPDLPGDVRAALRADTDLPVLYVNGTAGDVSTRFTRQAQTPQELRRLAGLVTEAWHGPWRPVRVAPTRTCREVVELPAASDDPSAVRRRLTAAEARLADEADTPRRRVLETEVQGLRRRLDRVRSGEPTQPVIAEAHTIVLGDLALAALPGEPVTAVGRTVRAASRYPVTLPIGYAGDYIGYLTTADMTTGYEAEVAIAAPGAAELVAAALARQLRTLEEA